ncbi:LytTR family DNA-binding domain-containing protein [Ramlibacter sp.]|uniref:LytR/AlgR family response regulator transcription factor n=1 Tax=Ramlibacter sp. TaxID=1917967 RepID=UPI002C57BD34|nr:LytTR family DNA-binding domain-containing protein [Ramlibacter sp.]HWI81014.1 LytTR family DNA-binding domain-containing protein [Ramlibacter sp.]
MPTALIADDEPLLRQRLAALLARLWPELQIAGQARNGSEALALFERLQPQVAFLDVQMPGASGIEVARRIAGRAEVVFVTAYDQYAVEAFRHRAVDYLVKPLDEQRLAETVGRLQARLQQPAADGGAALAETLDRIAADLRARLAPPARLQWIKASVGSTVRLIPVDEVIYLKSDNKYTLVVWDGGEALIRKTIRELADELDPQQFVQVHRSAIVSLRRVSQFVHGSGDTGELLLKGRPERVPVSRSFQHLFQAL